MLRMRRFVLLLAIVANVICEHQGSQYLNKAVRDLRQLNVYQTLRRGDVEILSSTSQVERDFPTQEFVDRRDTNNKGEKVPPLALTKSDLAALYETAISKGETLKLGAGEDSYINAAVHELDDDSHIGHTEEAPSSSNSGYYYYYYPIKSFIDELTSQTGPEHEKNEKYKHEYNRPKLTSTTTQRPPYQFHSHQHQHNITINKTAPEEKKPSKSLEPLFMAISGFIGMAVMLLFSVVVMPKLNAKPSTKKSIWKRDEDLDTFSRLALRAIDGENCAERFACELSQTAARAFGMQNNRFVKLFRRLAPSVFSKHTEHSAKYRYKEIKCTAIPCRKKNNPNKNPKNKINANNNNKNNKIKNPKQKKS